MSRRAIVAALAVAACAMGLGWGIVRAQEREATTVTDADAVEAPTPQRLAAAAPMPDASDPARQEQLARITDASQREVALELARRVADIDLTWGEW